MRRCAAATAPHAHMMYTSHTLLFHYARVSEAWAGFRGGTPTQPSTQPKFCSLNSLLPIVSVATSYGVITEMKTQASFFVS